MKQPEALRLADELAVFATWRDDVTGTLGKSAAELRRLHEANQAMLEALKWIDPWTNGAEAQRHAIAAIAKGEQS